MELMEYYLNMMKIIIEAVSFCCAMEHLTEKSFFKALKNGKEDIHSRLRYALAKGISNYLGKIDENLESVYVYGSTANDNARLSSDIDLIVKVKSKNGSTGKALKILDSCLLINYKILMADDQVRMSYMLDVHMIDESDVQQRNRYGSLLSFSHTAPIKVWSRA